MKILLVTPNFHQPRGNTITVQRINDGLERLDIETEILSITETTNLKSLPIADLVHGFHAYRFYCFKEKLKDKIGPFIITITGTDLNHDLYTPGRREKLITCLEEASAIHVFDHKAKRKLLKEVPEIEHKIIIIHQGVTLFSEEKHSLPLEKEKETFLFVLPAGIRKVKNIPSAINMAKALHDKYPFVRLWLVGPVLDDDEGQMVQNLIDNQRDWIRYIGPVEHTKMGSILKNADVVLNTSLSEGQPSSILEAMGNGFPVLVSDIPGNRTIVEHGVTGLVYKNESEFLLYAEELLTNEEKKKQLILNAKKYIEKEHSSDYEASRFVSIYKNILGEK